MPENRINPHRQPAETHRYRSPHVGIVKENSDAQRMGRILVHIPDLGGDPAIKSSWFQVRYMSPFAGATPIEDSTEGSEDWNTTQSAYGMWFPVPDLENHVVIMFLNGDATKGFYIGGFYQQYMNNSVPGLPGEKKVFDYISKTNTGQAAEDAEPQKINYAPTTEYNKKYSNAADKNLNPEDPPRPPHVPLLLGLSKQGLTGDYTRGINTSSARRTQMSRSYGFLTPRGTQIVYDDGYLDEELNNSNTGDVYASQLQAATKNPATRLPNPANSSETRKDEYIRFRTRSGAGITINETHGYIYLISKDGNNWVEMANDGHIDVYAKDDISVHSEQSINLHAEKDINIEAGRNINIKSNGQHVEDKTYGTGNIYLETGPSNPGTTPASEPGKTPDSILHSNIHMTSHNNTFHHVGNNHHIVVDNNALTHIRGNFDEYIGANLKRTIAKNYDVYAVGNVKETSGATWNVYAAEDYTEDTGAKVYMNCGKISLASFADTATDATLPKVYDLVDKEQKNKPNDIGTLNIDVESGITDRVPEHEPWSGHREKAFLTDKKIKAAPSMSATSIEEYDKEAEQPPGVKPPNPAVPVAVPPGTPKIAPVSAALREKPLDTSNKQLPTNRQVSEEGVLALLSEEGFRANQYSDGGKQSIGYGHQITGEESAEWKAKIDRGLTEEEAYSLFLEDIAKNEKDIRERFPNKEMTQGEFDALTSLSYNIGTSGIGDMLTSAVKTGDPYEIADVMLLYNHSGDTVVPGLTRRRTAEASVLITGEYPEVMSRAEHKAEEVKRLADILKSPGDTTPTQLAQAEGALAIMTA